MIADRKNRVLVFWSWNSRLRAEELRRQIDEFAAAGIGGYFLHARGGLKTPYLSAEWMEDVRLAAEYGAERGLDAYLYDEDGWPSGYAGGRVPAQDAAFCQAWMLPVRKSGRELAGDEVLAAFRDGTRAAELRPEMVYDAFVVRRNRSYANLLEPRAVRAFLQSTHEAYARALGDLFGGAIKGIFTDEPQLSNHGFPWYEGLEEAYRAAYGESLYEQLSLLTAGTEGDALRFRYRKLIAEQYAASYSRQIGDWCAAHRLCLTGHMAAEDGPYCQIQSQADVMPHYVHFGMPGIDHLGRRKSSVVLLKQPVSVNGQCGRTDVLSETFGASGHGVKVRDLLDIWAHQAAHGVNVACLHLASYSQLGRRKRDYPPTFSYHLNWFPALRALTEPVAALCDFASRGERVADILVLSPLSAFWMLHKNDGLDARLSEITVHYRTFLENLLAAGLDCDLGDELLMAERAAVEGNALRVGACKYHTVIVPKTVNLCHKTVELLEALAAAGGRLLFVEDLPDHVDGRPDDRLEALFAAGKIQPLCMRPKLMRRQLLSYGVTPAFRLWTEDGTAPLEECVVTLRRECTGTGAGGAAKIVPETGEPEIVAGGADGAAANAERADTLFAFVLNSCRSERRARFSWRDEEYFVRLGAAESVVLLLGERPFVYRPQENRTEPAEREIPCGLRERRRTDWQCERLDENVLVLDRAEAVLDGRSLGTAAVLDQIERVYGALEGEGEVLLRYPFANTGFEGPITLAVEHSADLLFVRLNGSELTRGEGWYYDRELFRYPADRLRPGENVVELRYRVRKGRDQLEEGAFETETNRYFYDTEFENVFVLGDFGVAAETERRRNALGEFILAESFALCPKQEGGAPFYRGRVRWRARIPVPGTEGRGEPQNQPVSSAAAVKQRVTLRLSSTYPVAEVRVNGEEKGFLVGGVGDVTCDVAASCGALDCEVLAYTSDRNLMGPHHYFDLDTEYTGPGIYGGRKGWEDLFNQKTPEALVPDCTRISAYVCNVEELATAIEVFVADDADEETK